MYLWTLFNLRLVFNVVSLHLHLQLKGDIKYGGDLCHVDRTEADLKASLQWIVRKMKVLSELMTIDVL